MKQLSNTQRILFLIGGIMMVVGAGLYVFGPKQISSWLFLVGAILYTAMQVQQSYEGDNFTLKRLRRIMLFSDVCFILASLLMIENAYNFLLPLFLKYVSNGINSYMSFIVNKWVVALLVAALLQVYTTHRIDHELDKEAKKR